MKWRGSIAAALLLASSSPAMAQASKEVRTTPVMRMPELPPAVIDETLQIGGEAIEAEKRVSRMTAEVMVNGKGPYNFVVDSGADTSVIGQSLAGKLGLPDGEQVFLHGVTESRMVDTVKVDTLGLGPTETVGLELPVLDESDLGGDGMIGLDTLVEQRLMLDFEKRIITVDDERSAGMFGDGIIVVTGRLERGQLILTEVTAEKEKVDAIVDTGSEITIGNLALRDKLLRRHFDEFSKIKVYGVTGAAMELDFAIIKRLKVGPIILQNVPIAFADIPPFEVLNLTGKPSLLLGTDMMENFRRVSLDFKERKARFQLKKCDSSRVFVRTTHSASRISADRDTACS
ncbi:aspartyl protease family protein [Qipengyuania sp. RANM35]|uniref:aspartyl protease family protein n=1 Tax=Qipengyuania sp. RANM35 TaxID=3068635 RepID=UPI0034DADA79